MIVIFPQCTELPLIEQVRAYFDPLAAHVPVHITLVFPFRSTLSTADLSHHMEQGLANIQPFQVVLGEVTGHTDEYLFLNVKQGNDTLITLHNHLYSGLLEPYYAPQFTYTPHLTVGRIADRAVLRTALMQARAMLPHRLKIVVDRVNVYWVEANGNRSIEMEVHLQASVREEERR